MGKVRVTQLGGEEEEKLRDRKRVSREEKKKREKAEKVRISGMKGGQRITAVGAGDEEEVEKMAKLAKEVEKERKEDERPEEVEKKAKKKRKVKLRSKKYQQLLTKIDHNKYYPIKQALPLLREISYASFDASVELHINTIEKGLRGMVALPHGTGKQIKIAVADENTIDKLIEKVSKGKIDFDALIAHPQVVAKLASVAKFLGPRGLMPNPKNGTISEKPKEVAEKMKKGEVSWKTESQFPLIHQIMGKLSFKDNQLIENFQALVKSIGENKIKKITLKSTMSPGIKIQLE